MQENNKKSTVEIIADNEHLTLSKLAMLIGCKPQNMYDIKSGKAKSVSVTIADKIVSVFPQYSRTWILTGDGNMIKDPPPEDNITAIVNNQVGNGNHFNSDMTVNQFMVELSAQRKLTEKAQEQMDRLITIIEKMKG